MSSTTKSQQASTTRRPSVKLIARYGIVGGLAYIIEMLVLYGLQTHANIGSVAAVAISFWVGFIAAFVLQKIIAFQNHDARLHVLGAQIAAYSALVAWNYGFSLISVALLDATASIFVIRTFVILCTTSWNFVLYRKLFKSTRNPIES